MHSLSVTLDTGRTYSLIGVIRGTVTTGVTLAPTTGTRPGQTPNTPRLTIAADNANGGNNVAYGDAGIATNGTSGRIMLAGDVDVFQGSPNVSLNFYLAVSANGTKVNLAWD